ncbi:transcriptional regulator [Marinitoga piezophila KA3]|uniref:Transcriptional regulator n=1 Tax=Marinitoga piezophila (strain DSM 14283 / JCM 11233 / KA3) TaxID=443254 RepID=H2J4T3_MARPK|nr:LacI family DNA-binding transcriptional regulator [Marinitoga piezophila]AEX84868.1 transcriptional regulator [Marinitoga piezophila KA3]
MKRINIKDVAKEAGVSISTVSRVINKSAPVKEELRKKVEEAIKKLEYKPSIVARSLRKGKAKTIGLVIPDITDPYFPHIVKGIEDYLKKEDYTLLLSNSGQDLEQETKIIETFESNHIDGVIFIGSGLTNPYLKHLKERGIKVVYLDRILKGIDVSYVVSDNKQGMHDLLQYLYDTNHRSFHFVNGNENTFSAQVRYEAFAEFMEKNNIKSYKHIYSCFSYDAGYQYGKEIDLKKLPDVIMGGNDLIAYGLMDALDERGVKIPDDVSITGFNDIPFSRHYKPSLTTVRQPIYKMGYTAANLIIQIINSDGPVFKGIVLKTELIVRNSTRRRD